MPIEITMPKLTDTMSEATLAKWLKKEGDTVKPGDMIAEVETDKATQELETFEAGTIAKIMIPEGGKTPVGALIVVLAKAGEDPKQVAANIKPGAAPAPKAEKPKAEQPKEEKPKAEKPAPQSTPTVAEEGKERTAGAQASAPEPTPTPTPEPTVEVEDHYEGSEPEVLSNGKIRVSPLARKIADEKGIDISTVRGTGPDGRIIKRDILEAMNRPAATKRTTPPTQKPAASQTAAPAPKGLEHKNIPLSNMRQVIARRLVQSKQTIPHFYLSIDVVMDKLLELRVQLNDQLASAGGEKLSVTDYIAKAVTVALTRVPSMNSSFTETTIIQHGTVDLGIAVALDDGLLVPVIRGAHAKTVRQISQEIKSLAELARSKKLKADQMTGSTFTISNLGMYGIKNFNAIINPPESAILAVGGTTWQPIVKESKSGREVVPAQVMNLTLSADHRAVDGATGAKFLQELKNILESPVSMLL
jgi:pyruvate dehydrogenase E2 component (dihydrolipoamide acetyltransferase)